MPKHTPKEKAKNKAATKPTRKPMSKKEKAGTVTIAVPMAVAGALIAAGVTAEKKLVPGIKNDLDKIGSGMVKGSIAKAKGALKSPTKKSKPKAKKKK